MLEKNIDIFANVLEEMNMKETAETFRFEFRSKSNDEYELGKYNILKHLQTQLNRCTGSNYKNKYSPTSKKKHREPNETFDSLLNKLSKKQKISSETPSISSIDTNSKTYLHLSEKIEKEFNSSKNKKNSSKISFTSAPQYNYYSNDENEHEEEMNFSGKNKDDLPCFGSSAKKECEPGDHIHHPTDLMSPDEIPVQNEENNSKIQKATEMLNRSFGAVAPDIKNESFSLNQSEEVNMDNSIDEYTDDEDVGFELYECEEEYFKDTCMKLSEANNFPKRAVYKSKYKNYSQIAMEIPKTKEPKNKPIHLIKTETIDKKPEYIFEKNPEQDEIWTHSKLDKKLVFPQNENDNDEYYPVYYKDSFIDQYSLKFVVDRERTGFEESKDFKIVINNLIAGRYQILAYLGNAAFSKAAKCLDVKENKLVCLKIIENHKDYFDQSLDEIKVLRFINANGDSEEKHFLKLYDYFYYKEHLFIVTELLKDNLYEFYDYLTKNKIENYFTLPRLQLITKQILECLDYIHSLHLIHCDLKPENILIKSISDTIVKVIDFGSSSFIHDTLSSYIQSRSYRAPEVIMGCNYDYKIDIWSLGCILAELYTGNVLFQSDSVQSLLARVIGIVGPIPDWMFSKGKTVKTLFSKEKLLFMEAPESSEIHSNHRGKNKKMHIIIPKRSCLKKRLHCQDDNFVDFVKTLLTIDPNNRPSAKEALNHPWLTKVKY